MKTFEIWMEGFLVSGMEGVPQKATKLGTIEAETFDEACDLLCFRDEVSSYDSTSKKVWGCKLYDNELDARKLFG